jgi:hypothetical protein
MPDVTSVREAARGREDAALALPVTLILDDAVVSGTVGVAHGGGLHYDVDQTIDGSDAVERWLSDGSLDCSRDGAGMRCGHVDEAIESTRALLEARRIRTALQDLAQAREVDAGVLGADHQASSVALDAAAGAAEEAGEGAASRWADNPAPFQAAYREARARRRRGEPAVPFMADNATGGLGAREGGRSFGVEMEFDIDPSVDQQRTLQAIADDLHAEGILRDSVQERYHSSSDFTRWRYEEDETVDGEIITPIMYDDAESLPDVGLLLGPGHHPDPGETESGPDSSRVRVPPADRCPGAARHPSAGQRGAGTRQPAATRGVGGRHSGISGPGRPVVSP